MKLISMMLVRNEEHRYLREVLTDLLEYVDEIVILDDASTDKTMTICNSFKRIFVETLGVSLWKTNEKLAREILYKMTIERDPDFILAIDADEIFEDRFKQEVREMVDQPFHWYSFHWYSFNWYNFWTPDSYSQVLSSSMKSLRRLFKYCPKKYFSFTPGHHCGSTPEWVRFNEMGKETDIRVKHFGFIRKEDRLRRIQVNKDTGNEDYAKRLEHLEQLFEQGKLKLTQWEE